MIEALSPDFGPTRVLVASPDSTAAEPYAPLSDETGLFRIFAGTEPAEDSILSFAGRFGKLGPGAVFPIEPVSTSDPLVACYRIGEPLGTWQFQIRSLQQVVDLWDLVQHGDEHALARHIRWDTAPGVGLAVTYLSHPGAQPGGPFEVTRPPAAVVLASERDAPELLERLRHSDVYGPALLYIQRVINQRIAGLVSVRAQWSGQAKRLPLQFVPESLLGAIWLQFALAVDGNRQYRQCEACGRPFEVAPDKARTSRRFCRDSCRVQAHRRRQVEQQGVALRMHAEGKTFKQIAAALGMPVAQVKKLVASSKE
jgi:hypothetical protein